MSFPQPSGPTRMNGSLFSIQGSIMLNARFKNRRRARRVSGRKTTKEVRLCRLDTVCTHLDNLEVSSNKRGKGNRGRSGR